MPLIKLDMSELAQAISNLGRAESWVPPVIHKQMPMLGKQISALMKNQLSSHDYLGTLSQSVQSDYDAGTTTVTIGPDAKRGSYDAGMIMEMGTAPIPNLPWYPIKAWAEARGVNNPRGVWLGIRAGGVQPHPFLEATMNRFEFSATMLAAMDIMAVDLTALVFAGDTAIGGVRT